MKKNNSMQFGENFQLDNDELILSINSPKTDTTGPYTIVYKDIIDRWVIVTLLWDNKPRLAIRWFWGNMGTPISRAYPTWFIIPDVLVKGILSTLPIEPKYLNLINDFLCENNGIDGEKLREYRKK